MAWEEWAAELAAMARAGGEHPATPYDAARYARIAQLAGELHSYGQGAETAEQTRVAMGRLGSAEVAALEARTLIVAAEAAVFDPLGRVLLIQRADSKLWALPGGAADVGDLPAGVAEREAWEETGLRVRAERLIGAYTRPGRSGAGYYLWVLVFLCHPVEGTPVVTHETLDVGYFAQDSLPPLHRGHDLRVPDVFAAHAAGDAWVAVYD